MTDIRLNDLFTGIKAIGNYIFTFVYAFFKARRELVKLNNQSTIVHESLDEELLSADINKILEEEPKKDNVKRIVDHKKSKKNITTKLLKDYYKNVVLGDIKRYELDNINALNFILNNSLGGGGSETLLNDAQGKTHAQLLLMMEVNLPKELYATI